MAQLRRDYEKFTEQDAEIIVIGREEASAFFNYWQRNDLPFIGLPDPTLTVLKLYGQEVKLFKFGRMPAQLLIDKQGMARFVHYGHDAANIPENEETLELLQTMNEELHANS